MNRCRVATVRRNRTKFVKNSTTDVFNEGCIKPHQFDNSREEDAILYVQVILQTLKVFNSSRDSVFKVSVYLLTFILEKHVLGEKNQNNVLIKLFLNVIVTLVKIYYMYFMKTKLLQYIHKNAECNVSFFTR